MGHSLLGLTACVSPGLQTLTFHPFMRVQCSLNAAGRRTLTAANCGATPSAWRGTGGRHDERSESTEHAAGARGAPNSRDDEEVVESVVVPRMSATSYTDLKGKKVGVCV